MIKNQYILLLISELYDYIHEIKWFITLDLREAYNLIRIKKKEKWKIAFQTYYNHYEYLVILFKLINVFIFF